MSSPTRKLAAIMFTDIVGYTALMGKDEQKALELIRQSVALQKHLVAKHNGKWIKEMGDGAIAQFNSALDAVNCAVDIQNVEFDGQFRIGIHLGDITIENNDIFGDGVNVASRLQSIADNGGIYISDAVKKSIRSQSNIQTLDLGEKSLKNVDYSVRTFSVQGSGLPVPKPQAIYNRGSRKSQLTWTVLIVITSVVVIGFGLFLYGKQSGKDGDRPAEKSIAVLAFDNMSNDPGQEYFSDGISEEIINALVKIPELKVAGRTSSFSFKKSNDDLKTIAQKLNVSLILEGSVRRSGDQLRVTAQLVDVATGYHLWSENYNGDIESVFQTQDEITRNVVDKMRLTLALQDRYYPNPEAYDYYLKGLYFWNQRGESLLKARDFFIQAIQLDPDFALAYALLSQTYTLIRFYHLEPPQQNDSLAMVYAEKALEHDPNSTEAYASLGFIHYTTKWDLHKSTEYFNKSISINPNYATVRYWNGLVLINQNEIDKAENQILKSIEIDPLSPIALGNMAVIRAIQNDFKGAIDYARKASELYINVASVSLEMISLANLDRYEDAVAVYENSPKRIKNNPRIQMDACMMYYKLQDHHAVKSIRDNLIQRSKEEYIPPLALGVAAWASNDLENGKRLIRTAVDQRETLFIALHNDQLYSKIIPELMIFIKSELKGKFIM